MNWKKAYFYVDCNKILGTLEFLNANDSKVLKKIGLIMHRSTCRCLSSLLKFEMSVDNKIENVEQITTSYNLVTTFRIIKM